MQCRRQSIQSRGTKSKSRGPKFLLILALEKHAVHNAVTSINTSLMQSEIGCYKFKIAFSEAFLELFRLLISAKGSGGAL